MILDCETHVPGWVNVGGVAKLAIVLLRVPEYGVTTTLTKVLVYLGKRRHYPEWQCNSLAQCHKHFVLGDSRSFLARTVLLLSFTLSLVKCPMIKSIWILPWVLFVEASYNKNNLNLTLSLVKRPIIKTIWISPWVWWSVLWLCQLPASWCEARTLPQNNCSTGQFANTWDSHS